MATADFKGYQKGDVLDYKNKGTNKIDAFTIVTIGSHIGIASGDIAPGDLGALYVDGVFKLPKKASEAVTMGTDVYWTEGGCSATGTVKAGYAIADAAADDKFVSVKL